MRRDDCVNRRLELCIKVVLHIIDSGAGKALITHPASIVRALNGETGTAICSAYYPFDVIKPSFTA